MRPWEREQVTSPPDSPPRLKGSLSSMVVKPTEEELGVGGGGESPAKTAAVETREEMRSVERRRRDEVSSPDRGPRSQRSRDGSEIPGLDSRASLRLEACWNDFLP